VGWALVDHRHRSQPQHLHFAVTVTDELDGSN